MDGGVNDAAPNRALMVIQTFALAARMAAIALPLAASAALAEEHASTIQRDYINPATGYTQVVAVTSGSTKTLYVSGQIGEGETLEAQLRAVFTGLRKQLRDGGGDFEHLVKINTYIVGYRPEDLDLFRSVRKEFLGDARMPASTLIGVQSLALRDWLVEIEAVAVVEVARPD